MYKSQTNVGPEMHHKVETTRDTFVGVIFAGVGGAGVICAIIFAGAAVSGLHVDDDASMALHTQWPFPPVQPEPHPVLFLPIQPQSLHGWQGIIIADIFLTK